MPLIDFKTDLKSLRYGSDRPGGGSSNQPYIQSPIPDVTPQTLNNNTIAFFQRYYETNRTSLDFPIRGGQIVEPSGLRYSTPSGEIDRLRIQSFLKDAPRGTTFALKQAGLQLTNPNTQVPNTFQFAGVSLDNAVLPTTRTYNPLNTLAQVAIQGTGAHFNRHGVTPTLYESPQTTYQYIVANSNTAGENRLALLATLKLRNANNFQFSAADIFIDSLSFGVINQLGISPIQNQILNYQGGPGSVYGIGSTIIRRATSTVPDKVYSRIAFTYDQLADQTTRPGGNPLLAEVQDFRNQLVDKQGGTSVPSVNYPQYSMVNRLNIGNPGQNSTPRIAYNEVIPGGADLLNQKNLFYFNASTETPWSAGGGSDTKDLIKFAFECMSNDSPGNAVGLIFRAFIDGAIQDNHTGDYSSFKYLGRGETFRTYQGFERDISFTFKILVQSRSEMKPLYKKLNHLISQVYPDYSPVTNFMRGSVVKLTIGDYIYRMPGFLNSVNITLDTNVGWEIVLNQFDETGVAQLPLVVTVNCSFKPIMDILPRRENYENPYVPIIVNGGLLDPRIRNTRPDTSPITRETPDLTTGLVTTTLTGSPEAIQGNIPNASTVGGQTPGTTRRKSNQSKPSNQGQTPKLDPILFQQPRVLQDNTNIVNPLGRGGRGSSTG
jgi:hypothetical protein